MALRFFSASEIINFLRLGKFPTSEAVLHACNVLSEKINSGDILNSPADIVYFENLQKAILNYAKNQTGQLITTRLSEGPCTSKQPASVNVVNNPAGQLITTGFSEGPSTSKQSATVNVLNNPEGQLITTGFSEGPSTSKQSATVNVLNKPEGQLITTGFSEGPSTSKQSATVNVLNKPEGQLITTGFSEGPSTSKQPATVNVLNKPEGFLQSKRGLDYPHVIEQVQSTSSDKFKHFKVISEGMKHIQKFKLTAKSITFKFNDVPEARNPILWMQNAFDEIIEHMTTGAEPNDHVGMVMHNDNFPEKPIGISFRRVDQLSSKVVMAVLEKILQSNAQFFSQEAMRLQVDRITLPNGKGRNRLTGVSFDEFCQRRRDIIVINNEDNYCLARALVMAMAWRNSDPLLYIMKYGNPLLDQRAYELCNQANVDLSNGGTREHIEQFQQYLGSYTIVVYDDRLGKTVYYEGPRASDRGVLNLILENNHYNVITNLCSAFATKYFCELCRVRLSHKTDHKNCRYICPACHTKPPCNNNNVKLIKCDHCHRDFRGQNCFAEHTKQLCKTLRRCQSCLSSVWEDKRSKHRCGYKYCNMCKSEQPIRHLCFMVKNKPDKAKLDRPFVFIIYDLECRQDTLVDGTTNIYQHQPNLCVAQNVCNTCIDNADISQDCSKCGKRQHIFKENPVDDFLNYVSKIKAVIGNVVVLAHNMKGYDGPFVLKALVKNKNGWRPSVISTGTKLMSITCDSIKFIDSLNYMPMPLNKLPKTFNFPGSKGFFPHLFNTLARQNYNGTMPEIHYYGPDEMTSSTRREFLDWYNGEVARNAVFNMQDELVKYCISDVDILRKACVEFWRRYSMANGVDPFREACTIAGACNTVFRRKFLQEGTIALIPPGGYRMADRQSAIAIKWLLWLEHSLDCKIIHAGNSREFRLREGYLVDGFHAATNTVYQFHGCYFHGCETCFPDQTAYLGGDMHDTMFMRREKTEATATAIRSLGYKLEEMKECKFRNFLKINTEAAEFLTNHDIVRHEPLNPREGFFGGRTNAIKLYHKSEADEEIKYLDVCSLYPFVNKYGKYPLGHPKVHIGDVACRQLSLDTVEGLIKCTVLPATNLYHPILPHRMHGKLMFILCRTCAETMFNGNCTHTQDQRKFTGTYVADELRKGISLGYKVLEIIEIWEYEVTQYNRVTKTGGLFSGYVNTFLKIKQECSGWPSWCTDDQSKDRYVAEYLEHEGIALDKNKIAFNAGARYASKQCLTSFWGKFGQRENLMQTSIITDPYELFKKLTDPSVEVHALTAVSDDTIILNWDRHDECIQPLKTVNVVLAAYTTANARLELYKYLEKLDRRVLYFDTDSVIFTQKPGDWAPETGDFLGMMTDEIECYGPGSKITEFVSGGPKNYAFKVYSTNQKGYDFVCKVKGITLNYKNSQTVNFDTLKSMILEGSEDTYVHTDRRIVRTHTYDVVSRPEKKIFKVQYTKRRRIEDCFDTLPYGYRA